MNSVETHALRLIGEDTSTPDVFSDITPIRDSINQAVQEICLITGSYQRTYHVRLRTGVYVYQLPTQLDRIGWIVECWGRSRQMPLSQIDPITLAGLDEFWQQTTGYPEYYYYLGTDKLGIYRVPSANDTVLEMTCAFVPRWYTTDDEPIKLRDQYQRALAYYAAGEYYASRGDARRAAEWHQRYMDTAGIQDMHPDHPERTWRLSNKFNPRWHR